MKNLSFLLALAMLATGCKVGPNYKRPDVAAPPQFRSGAAQPEPASLGDMKWFDLYQDETLRGLIKQALVANYDVLIAAQRVLDAQGNLTATRSSLWPQIGVQGSANVQQGDSRFNTVKGLGGVSWELDLFGKLRRASEAARADLLASEESQKAVRQLLVAQVATAYFGLRELDDELEYTRESLALRKSSLDLVKARQQGGISTMLEVDQAQTLVASAGADQARLEKGVAQTENLINFLIGKGPGPIQRPPARSALLNIPEVPAGLPSTLIDRRPDIRFAEQQLVAANARVGVAKAAFFPSVALTGTGGWQSVELGNLFSNSSWVYGYGAAVDVPIFDGGRRLGNYRSAKAQKEALVINYQKAVANGFREVSDTLIGIQKQREYRVQFELLVNTLRDQSRLANLRYSGGVSSFLEVLDTERERLTAEQSFAIARRDELLALVDLYKALGGGWQE
jgi:multidrug efflux system outer membrane protein